MFIKNDGRLSYFFKWVKQNLKIKTFLKKKAHECVIERFEMEEM